MIDHNKIVTLSSYTKDEIGQTEENVKINFIVPLLEAFGHTRYEFEYKYKDIIIQKGIHKNSKVIVEAKSYDKKLEGELNQLKRYCDEERPLLGIIANGLELRIYSHFWRRSSFEDTLLYLIVREQLADNSIIARLDNILSKDTLTSGVAHQYVDQREKEIEAAEEEIKSLEGQSSFEMDLIKKKIKELEIQSDIIDKQITDFNLDINTLKGNTEKKVFEIWKELGFNKPYIVVNNGSPGINIGGNHSRSKQNIKRKIIDHSKQIELIIKPSDIDYGIIQFSKNQRSFFPGFDVHFVIESDFGQLNVHVTSKGKNIQPGNLIEGKYLTGNLKEDLYRKTKGPKVGDTIFIEMLEHHKRYRLDLKS